MRFGLNISSKEVMRFYEGSARQLIATSDEGLRVQIPLKNFRNFIEIDGLIGRFQVTMDENNKLIDLCRI